MALKNFTSEFALIPSQIMKSDFNFLSNNGDAIKQTSVAITTFPPISPALYSQRSQRSKNRSAFGDNTAESATEVGNVSTAKQFNNFVGRRDRTDFYRFSITGENNYAISLNGLKASASLQLWNSSKQTIAQSSSTTSLTLSGKISTGTYYLRVQSAPRSNTAYQLNLSATLVPPTVPTTPAPTPTKAFSPIYGYGLVDATAAIGKATGSQLWDQGSDPAWGWDVNQMNVPEAWKYGYTGQGIVVAVVDSGVDYRHTDLNDNLWRNSREIYGNGIDDDRNGYIDDVLGWNFVSNNNDTMDDDDHGSHVAGIIAAEDNGYGAIGIAYNAKIMPVKVLDGNGEGKNSSVAQGVYYAANNGAKIINLSLGGTYSLEIDQAISYATQKGSLVVMAAGNDGATVPGYPARNSSGIAVGSIDSDYLMADSSNRAGNQRLNYVVAPGVDIYSTLRGNDYGYLSGTSMAAPAVSAIAALVWQANPTLSVAELTSILTNTASA
jgi:subtilisin family serine protease